MKCFPLIYAFRENYIFLATQSLTQSIGSEIIYILSSQSTETSDLFLWDFFYNPRILDRDLDSLSHFCLLICDSSRLAYQLIGYVVGFNKSWNLIPHCLWPKGTTFRCPQNLDTMVHQHSTSNVGGDTNQR